MVLKANDRKRILHVLLEMPETNMVLQEFAVPSMGKYEIAICTLFKAATAIPAQIQLFEGNGKVRSFFRVLRSALAAGPYDIIHVHTPHVAIALLVLSLRSPSLLRSTVFTVHNSYGSNRPRSRLFLLPVFALFKSIVCCSQASMESFPWLYRSLAGRRLTVICNGVHTNRIETIRETQKNKRIEGPFTLISVSRLVPVKNLSTTVTAFSNMDDPDSRLIFVGEGPVLPALIDQSRVSGTERNVHFTGLLKREEVYQRLMGCDLFISTSFSEGLPIAVLEAMACGCPVLLSNIAPHREIACNVEFIPLVDPTDSDGFGREIRRFQRMSRTQRKEIGAKCRQLVRERFSLDQMHQRYDALFDRVIQVKNGNGAHVH